MSTQDSIKLISDLCDAFGPSGCEDEVAALIKKEISDICPNAAYDRMGNLIAVMRFGDLTAPARRRIMISAHMDEVGFMVTEIHKDGYIGFDTVGGISDSVIAGRRVKIKKADGTLLSGVIASKAIHHKDKEERKKAVAVNKLFIDIGALDREDAEKHVRIGDFVTFDSEFYSFGEGMIKGKAIDDRIGCAAMIEVMRNLSATPILENTDVCFCFTVREEIGHSGARIAAYELRPQYAIVLETTAIADIADVKPAKRVADVGKGVVISVMDRSTIYDKEFVKRTLDVACQNDIKAQVKRYVSGGNDAGHIHKTAEGAKVVTMSVPTRYLHSPACVAGIDDYFAQRDLCEAMIRTLCKDCKGDNV